MDIGKQLQSLLKEAAVYDAQGLYEESKASYVQVANIIKQHAHVIHNHKKLLNSVSNRLMILKQKIHRMEHESASYEMSDMVLDVMKRRFSSSPDKNQAALEGAAALAEFGQYESAVEEYTRLLKTPSIRFDAARNILRCHLAEGQVEKAVNMFRHWRNSGLMGSDEMTELRLFLQDLCDVRGLCIELPDAEVKQSPLNRDAGRPKGMTSRHVWDFSSISVRLPDGPHDYRQQEFDVVSQSGDVVTVLVPEHDKETVDRLKNETVLDPVHCFSNNAMLSGRAVVVGNIRHLSGANAGYVSIDIKIQNI